MATRQVLVSKDTKDYLLNSIISLTETLTSLLEEVSKWDTESEVSDGNS